MTDAVLLGALHQTFPECLNLALEQGLGLEIQAFAFPEVLEDNWRDVLETYKRAGLDRLPRPLAMHGPFMDMAPGSPDTLIREVTLKRTLQAFYIAEALNVQIMVFHTNFIASIHSPGYRYAWTQRNVDFWGPLAGHAARTGLTLALENMWEFDPDIIVDVLRAVHSPHLRACLDVGHTALFSKQPFETWLATVEPYLVHMHLNNNPGDIDEHQALGDGALDYAPILEQIRRLPHPPSLTLEMNTVADMRASFPYLHLPNRGGPLRALGERLAGMLPGAS